MHPSGIRALSRALSLSIPAVARGARRSTSATVAPQLHLTRQRVDQLVSSYARAGIDRDDALARLARGERPARGKPGRKPRGEAARGGT